MNIPNHIAIIPDGNRRWAKQHGLPTLLGHKRGSENFDTLLITAQSLGVKCVSAWAFSTENWKRDSEEVTYLFDLARELVRRYHDRCLKDQMRFIHLGRKDRIPKDILDTIESLEEETKSFTNLIVAIGIDYGGHDEIVRTISKLKLLNMDITTDNIESHLDTAELPQIDLIIRTGGEKRLSGFMSWQSEYAELYFSDRLFPDFTAEELTKALNDYGNRDRRFGGNSKLA